MDDRIAYGGFVSNLRRNLLGDWNMFKLQVRKALYAKKR